MISLSSTRGPDMALNEELFNWMRDRPTWQQELFLRVVGGGRLTDQEQDDVIAMILEAPEASTPRSVDRSDLPADLPAGTSISLNAIRHVQGVNRLAPKEELRLIDHGINVIFGFNASGKSGWSRIPKHAGRAEVVDQVLGDVFAEERDRLAPLAEIDWSADGRAQTTRYRLNEAASSDLAGMSVFDAACGLNFLSKDHAVDYVPQSLVGLQRLARAQTALSGRIDDRIAGLRPRMDIDLAVFDEGTKIRRAVEGLSAQTDIGRLRTAATVTPAMKARAEELTRQVAEITANTSEASAASADHEAERLDALATALERVAESLSSPAVDAARAEWAAVTAAEQLLSEMSASRFEQEPVEGVGSRPWMVMWQAAEAFVRELHDDALPGHEDDARCPLCQQELPPEVRDRLGRFAEFVRSDAEAQLAKARGAVERRRTELPDVVLLREANETALAVCAAQQPALQEQVEAWLTTAARTSAAIAGADDGVQAVTTSPAVAVRGLGTQRRKAAVDLRALRDPGREAELHAELAELHAANALSARLESIEGRVLNMKQIARLERVKEELTTGPISNRLRKMAEAFVTQELQSALREQLKAMNFSDVDVVRCTTSGREGSPRVGLKINAKGKATLRQVLSEGEQRRLSLAFFLAEVGVSGHGQPIVLDDPVCSIDHQGRRHIARVLAEAARDRQVVIFTHDLSFVEEVERAVLAADVPLACLYVAKADGLAGKVQPALPWDGLSVEKRCKALRNDLLHLRKSYKNDPDGQAYAEAAAQFAVRLRQAFERAVEDKVIGGVVKRGDPAVHITQLRDVAWTHEINAMAQQGLGENSVWAHDRSRASNPAPFTPDELGEGVDLLEKLVKATAALIKTRKLQNKEMAPVPGGSPTVGEEQTAIRLQLPGTSSDAA